MIKLELAFSFLKRNLKLIAGVVLIAVLIGGGIYAKHWYNNQLTASYNLGVKDTDNKWKIQQQGTKDKNQAYKDDQQILTDALSRRLAEEQERNARLQSQLEKKQNAYSKSDAGKKQGLDDQFVDIYNGSLRTK